MQSENGPCPLLAACNVLLLRNQLPLPPGVQSVDLPELLQTLSNLLLDLNSKGTCTGGKARTTDLHQSLESCIEVLPTLNAGLNVNCRFSSPREFEYTRELCVFDLLDISVVHGWLVSPEDKRAYEVITKHSYNTLTDKLVEFKDVEERVLGEIKKGATEKTDVTKILEEGAVIQEFLDKNASQLTYEGIIQLHSVLKNKEMAVFFRNHHFSVLLKHQDGLYLLCTDVGFCGGDAVWERLDAVDGDTVYLDGNFQPLKARAPPTGPGELRAKCPGCGVENDFATAGAAGGVVSVRCGCCGTVFAASGAPQEPLAEQTFRHCETRNQFPAPAPGKPWPLVKWWKCGRTSRS